MVVISFLLIYVIGAIKFAAPVFLITFVFNALLVKNQAASKIVHLIAVIVNIAYFFYLVQDELGRSIYFMLSYFVGTSLCYLVYFAALKNLNKKTE